ncbi:MerR family DNA-binding transcriptional regulator [Tolypothrix sp. VBCCA 56010]|uniref:MerR family DNA-binding transcriptional regulator n=1 Tax=Tolypothrix sp. VBCCA 56010 TaxID=3137731 RepID=UPI003D7F0A89
MRSAKGSSASAERTRGANAIALKCSGIISIILGDRIGRPNPPVVPVTIGEGFYRKSAQELPTPSKGGMSLSCYENFMWKVSEFGELTGVSASTLRRWESEGKLIL